MQATNRKREPKRSRTILLGNLEGTAGLQEVRIRDVSTNGALVETSTQLSVDEEIQLSCGDTSMTGRVAWVDGSWSGVEFHTPLSVSILADTVGNQLRVSAPRSYRHDRIPEANEETMASSRVISLRNQTL